MGLKNILNIGEELLSKIKDAIDNQFVAEPALAGNVVFWCDSGCDGGCSGSCLNSCLGDCSSRNR